ncbi:MAG: hypothetical protein RJA59_618, partial [Pseudomonadota bacterium]
SEVEVVSRRRSQVALAAVLGLLFLALLSGVIAALAVRPGDAPYAPPSRHAELVPRAEPPAVQVTAPVAAPASPSPAGTPEPAAAADEPPPSVSATAPPAPKPPRSRPGRNPPGVGGRQRSGENGPSGNDLLDPYGPTAR